MEKRSNKVTKEIAERRQAPALDLGDPSANQNVAPVPNENGIKESHNRPKDHRDCSSLCALDFRYSGKASQLNAQPRYPLNAEMRNTV
jgi:hypothetical protein